MGFPTEGNNQKDYITLVVLVPRWEKIKMATTLLSKLCHIPKQAWSGLKWLHNPCYIGVPKVERSKMAPKSIPHQVPIVGTNQNGYVTLAVSTLQGGDNMKSYHSRFHWHVWIPTTNFIILIIHTWDT